MNLLARIIAWINIPVNAMAELLLSPLFMLSGWLSNTIISAVTGVILLIIFKYTSNQPAIGQVRDRINGHLLSLKLFKDCISATLQAQKQIFKGALLLLFYAIRPMIFMLVPVILLLGQMGLWYQQRPLKTGEETVVSMSLTEDIGEVMPDVSIESMPAELLTGPVRILSRQEVCWKIRAIKKGHHIIKFRVDGKAVTKELAIGDGFMRVSSKRPGWNWVDIMLHSKEKPFPPDSIVRSITIKYPERISKTSGTDWWVLYFFIASTLFALLLRPFLKVRI